MNYLSHRLSAAMWSRVLLLWLALALVALAIGAGSLLLGSFVQSNVRAELESQQISFPSEENLSEEERAIPGMVENAGEQLTTGNEALVYSELIGLHMQQAAESAGYPDASYASLGGPQRQLRSEVAAAEEVGDEAALEEAQEELNTVNSLRNTLLTGSNLRGQLLSAFGWDNVATGIIVAGVIVIVTSLVFFGLFIYEMQRGHLPPTEPTEAKTGT